MSGRDFIRSRGHPIDKYLEARVSLHVTIKCLVAKGILRATTCVWNELPTCSKTNDRKMGELRSSLRILGIGCVEGNRLTQ